MKKNFDDDPFASKYLDDLTKVFTPLPPLEFNKRKPLDLSILGLKGDGRKHLLNFDPEVLNKNDPLGRKDSLNTYESEIDTYESEIGRRRGFTVTAAMDPERARAIQAAAGDFAGKLSVRTFDPSDPAQRASYAQLVADVERERQALDYNADRLPRTPEEVDRQIIDPAERAGRILVSITDQTTSTEGCFPDFWSRVDEISAAAAAADDAAQNR